MVGIATLEWPMERAVKFAWERGYIDNIQDRNTRPRTNLLELSEEELIRRYVQELRGVSNYYSRAKNWKHVGNLLHWWCQDSLARTLGKKMRMKRPLVYARYNKNDAFGIIEKDQRVLLLSTRQWKRYHSTNPDRKPPGSIPSFQN